MLSYISVGNPVVQFICHISSSYYSSVPEKYQLSAKSNDSAINYFTMQTWLFYMVTMLHTYLSRFTCAMVVGVFY